MTAAKNLFMLATIFVIAVLVIGSPTFAVKDKKDKKGKKNNVEVKAEDGLVVITDTVDDVKVKEGGRVILEGATVNGKIDAKGAYRVELRFGTTVDGDVKIKESTLVRVVDSVIGGKLKIEKNDSGDTPININRNEISGYVKVEKNTASEIRINNNIIGGDLKGKENDAVIVKSQNIIGGDDEL